MRRRHEQTQHGVLGMSRRRHRKSWNKSQETFQPAYQPATATNISAYALSRPCPRDEQRSLRPVLPQRSTQVEETHYRDSKSRCDRNAGSDPRACRSPRRTNPVLEHTAPAHLLQDLDPALEWSPVPRTVLDDHERPRQCDRLSVEKDREHPPVLPNS